jgi:EAL domain-containing protein (putative c-di-GMP-specific phosphodiesterase class I)
LSAVFQPIVDTALGHIPGYEALIRGPESSRWRCSASSFSISVPWC